jgi:hypothetical protein
MSWQRDGLDCGAGITHATFVVCISLNGGMPKRDFCARQVSDSRILKVNVIEAVVRELAKFRQGGDQRVELFDVPESHIDAKSAAATKEFAVRTNHRRERPTI